MGLAPGVTHLAQAHRAGHVLQFAIAVGRTGQAVERVVGDVELHHAPADPAHLLGLGAHDHALGDRRGAGRGRAPPPVDLDDAEPARAERFERVRGAELRHLDTGLAGGAHDGGAGGHGHGKPVDTQRHRHAAGGGGAAVGLVPGDDEIFHVRSSVTAGERRRRAATQGAVARPRWPSPSVIPPPPARRRNLPQTG